ncbi:MAG: (2Fe-2S) ferredoxin domain-containing protein, partial [Merismopedia sp. SIO2A8]|nr:(2Fe-2S) ferredoxin domain-containing protein [Merismopedia sp. SIO2A8]
ATRACVMLCQKSSCRKRGAGDVYKAVTDSLRTRGLDEHVTIKTTGCQKQCKKGPVMVLMPDKSRYTQVDSQQISTIVDKHFACQLKSQQN